MIRFADARNIVVTGTIISYTPKPKGQSGPPDSNEMQVDGYETDVMLLLSRLRWSWTGWALIKDIWRTHKTMLVIPWNELPYLDSRGWQGFNATSGSVFVPKIDDSPGPVNMDQVVAKSVGNNALVRFNPSMWNAATVAGVGFIAKPADFKQAPGVGKDEILLHEMVHGLRQIRGTTDQHKPADSPLMDTVEEFMAIVVSNVYRSELKRPGLRADHHGFTPLPSNQEDARVFLNQPAKGGESNLSRMQQFKRDNPELFEDLKKAPASFNPFYLV
ncbi:MAG: M91 family zinc metallopeptidase [Steroidobacteraceae bacterium]